MQIREQRVLQQSEMHGAEESAEFTIAASGKAFKILMSGIYSNPQAAAVREVMTNAWDAQVEAGVTDRAFQVHVPSRFNPLFYVRDFGVSMTRQKVMSLYSRLFDSSKTTSNEVAGAFGIGSKAPFAVTDCFQVTTWLNGTKTVYQCQMHEAGIPKIHVVGEIASDEPQGVKVSFSVKEGDIDAFRKEIRKMLLGFDVMPELLNVDAENDTYLGKAARIVPSQVGPTWRLFGDDFKSAFDGSGLYARQGCVVYPIDLSQIETVARAQDKGAVLALFRSTNWSPADVTAILDFSIGKLSVAASRETLQYDDETINEIVAALDKLADELVADAVKLISAEPTPLKAARVFDGLQLGSSFRQLVGRKVKIEADVTVTERDPDALTPRHVKVRKEVPIQELVDRFKHGLRYTADKVDTNFGLVMAPVRKTASRPAFRPAFQLVVDVWKGATFVLDTGDLDRTTNRMVTFLEDVSSATQQVWWVRPSDSSTKPADTEAALQRFIAELDADLDYEMLRDFAPADLSTDGAGGLTGRAAYTAFRQVCLQNGGSITRMAHHRPEDGGLYVLLTRGQVKWTEKDGSERLMDLRELRRVVDAVEQLARMGDALVGQKIVGIIGHSHGLVDKHPGWTSLQDYLRGLVDANIDPAALEASAKAWACDAHVDDRHSPAGQKMQSIIDRSSLIADGLPADHIFTQISEGRLDASRPTRYDEHAVNMVKRWFTIDVPQFQPFKAPHISLAIEAVSRYPLLNALSLDSQRLDYDALRQYINLVDEAAKAASDDSQGDEA